MLQKVTTFAVVWIEIQSTAQLCYFGPVTTFAVVWIEIIDISLHNIGMKVTTFAVVWIEIDLLLSSPHPARCHHLRGGVD